MKLLHFASCKLPLAKLPLFTQPNSECSNMEDHGS